MADFFETERPVTDMEISDLENLIGYKLPAEYKNHLSHYNGGRCNPNMFSFTENGNKSFSTIDWFLAIYDGEYDNLIKDVHMFKVNNKRMPDHILPIAHDPVGNLICISCGPNDNGYVYFWDHEKEVDYKSSNDTDYSNLYLISETFNGFLTGLKEQDE